MRRGNKNAHSKKETKQMPYDITSMKMNKKHIFVIFTSVKLRSIYTSDKCDEQ